MPHAHFLPHIHHAVDDTSLHYALGYQGSGVALSLHAGKLLARRLAGEQIANVIPRPARRSRVFLCTA